MNRTIGVPNRGEIRSRPGHSQVGQRPAGPEPLLFPRPFSPALTGSLLDNTSQYCHNPHVPESKLEQLRSLIRSFGSCLTAYSGGVDSVFLAYVAHQELKSRALAAIADSPSLPRAELQEALEIARDFAFPVRVVRTQEFTDSRYLSNPQNRCYFCKHALFEELAPLARAEGFAVLAYGENSSDVGDHRPGAQAAAEFQVRAPLKEVGITKAEIRELSAQLGLPTAEKPQMACLSSRVPYGEDITPAKLEMIEAAEGYLRSLGFIEVRVRHHELRHGALARLELGPLELARAVATNESARIVERLRSFGYLQVTLDLQGYRRGSANEAVSLSRTVPDRIQKAVVAAPTA